MELPWLRGTSIHDDTRAFLAAWQAAHKAFLTSVMMMLAKHFSDVRDWRIDECM
jgi:hypothetical protein